MLFVAYRSIPEVVVLYRPPGADTPTVGPKSLLTVGRIVLMGVGQLGAATVMVFASRGDASWERFWRWLGLVASAKTLLECASLLVPHGSAIEMALTWSTLAVVGLFLLRAVGWWRRGGLRAHPPLTAGPRMWLFASLALWAVFALAPRWFVERS